jgi:hypothetical protein
MCDNKGGRNGKTKKKHIRNLQRIKESKPKIFPKKLKNKN